MASPFSIFRKHQKSLMVVLVIGSMIAFTGESLFTSGGQSWPLLGALLGIAIALIAGFQFGRPLQYAIGGMIVGGLLGFIAPSVVGTPGMKTELGVFDEDRISELIAKRTVANQFIGEVRRRAFGIDFGGQPFGLVPGNIQRDVIIGEALRAEADEMGIHIDDEAVTDFIHEQTGNKLSAEDFVAVSKQVSINNLPLSETELYDLLRDEIKARVALQTLVPFGDSDTVTPDSYWDLHQRMNVRQQVSFAQVDVDNFLGSVGEPSDAEVDALFEKYKDKSPNLLEPGAPGFYQERRMKLAYVEADYGAVEASIPATTDEEVQKYYDDNKEQFKKEVVPEDPSDSAFESELKNLEELEKEAFPDMTPEPAAGADKTEAVGSEAEAAEENAGDDNQEGDGGCDPIQDEQEEEQAAEDQEAIAPPPADPVQEGSTAPPVTLTIPQSNDEPTGADPFQEPPVEYLPLDAKLRAEIAAAVKQDKAFAKVDEMINAAFAEMQRLSNERDDRFLPGATGDEMSDVQICEALKAFADSNGLAYAETPLATGLELLDREEYPIGSATQPTNQFGARQPNVVQMMFGGGGSAAQFLPARAELSAVEFDGTINQYAYWVIADIPPHLPTLEEDGIRDQVVKAWKRQQARPKAKERAEAIAAMVTKEFAEEVNMSKILENETQSGSDNTAKLVVTESLPFSWMRTSSAASPVGFQTEQASLTRIDGVVGINDDFMDYIFNDLKPNEVGAVANADLSAYYVVQPLNRYPSDEADKEAALETFLSTKHFEFNSAMPGLVRQQFGQENLTWLKKLESKHGIDWGT